MTNQITEINFTVNPEAVRSFHDDGVVILHAGNGRLFTSNETGARIWRGIEQQLRPHGRRRRTLRAERLQHIRRSAIPQRVRQQERRNR